MKIAVILLLVAAVNVRADIKSCPKYCSCSIEGISGIDVVCSQLNPAEQQFSDIVQHLKVIPDPKVPLALTDFIFQKLGLDKLESLELTNTTLTDISEHAFHGLTSLNDINLANNQLFLLHPETFTTNTNLHRVKLSGNPMQLIQVLPNSQPYLLRSSSLSEFDLSNCQLSQILPKTFSKLKNLIFVNLSSNYLKVVPKDVFESLEYLEELDLSNNNLNKIEKDTFKHNSELSSLKLRKNPIETLNGLNISSLDELDLSYCKLHILMKETLEGICQVTFLNLSNNQISVISDDTFTSFRDLKKLDLSYNKLIGPLPKDLFRNNHDLEVLLLSGNKELGSFVEETGFLEHHSAMQKLEIADCGLTQLSSGELKGMDDLNILNVSNNAIRDLDESTFKHLRRLNTLDLSYNKLLSLNIHLFAGNPELIKLKLNGNPLKYLTPFLFSHNPILKFLDISSCELEHIWDNDKTDDMHHVLSKLVHLDISKNKLKMIHKQDFAGMKQLEVVDVKGNPLQCLGPTIEVMNLFDSKQIEPYRYHSMTSVIEPQSSRWDEIVEKICKNKTIKLAELKSQEAKSAENTRKLNRMVPARILENTQTSFTKVDEIVVETDNGAALWPMVLIFSILLVVLYFIVYLVGEISHRRRSVSAPYSRPGLGGHVRSRDSSGSPLYYKLYEECSIPDQPEKKKNYVLDFSPIHTILKKNTTYKIMKNNEVNV